MNIDNKEYFMLREFLKVNDLTDDKIMKKFLLDWKHSLLRAKTVR